MFIYTHDVLVDSINIRYKGIIMSVFAYYTPQVASPINDRRAGTIRVGSDSPSVIQVMKGWDAQLYFAFRDMKQKALLLEGRTVTAILYNQENTQLWTGAMNVDLLVDGAASVKLSKSVTDPLSAGLYNLVLTYVDDFGTELPVMTMRSAPRFVIELVDLVTVNLNV